MIIKKIFTLVFAKWLEESSEHINWRRLKKQQFIFLYLSDFSTYLAIKWEKKSIIILIRSDKSIGIFPEISSCWFIKDIISDNVILTLEVLDNFEPHFNKLIIHTIFICEEIMREANYIIRYIIFEERHFQTVLFERITIFISSKIDFERCREAKCGDQPIWKSFSTKSLTVKIMMSIDNN